MLLVTILVQLALVPIDGLSLQPGISSNTVNIQQSSNSDRILSPEYYKGVYKNKNNSDDADRKFDGRTPWDIGNNRPQPAVVRAYKEGKIHGNVLDAGCGVGENCIYLADKYGIKSITGFDLSDDAVHIATNTVGKIVEKQKHEEEEELPLWTTPKFLAASCTDVADRHSEKLLSDLITDDDDDGQPLFDVVIDSGLLHCLSKEDARDYVNQISKLLQPNTGRFYIGCFSAANPDPWDNPRRISEDYVRNELFLTLEKWDVVSCRECWWARPPSRGSSTGGAFSLALWIEVRLLL